MTVIYANIKPMIKETSYLLLILAFPAIFFSCIREDVYTLERNHMPRQKDDGFATGTPRSEGMNGDGMENLYDLVFDENRYTASRSLLIVRNGKLVSESYFRCETHISQPENIQGITGGITSLLFGIALEKGYIEDFDHRLYRYIPEYFGSGEQKRNMNFHHVLTMQSGQKWNNSNDTPDFFQYKSFPSSLRIVLQKESVAQPGTLFNYSHGDAQLISGVISKTSGMSLEEFASVYLFEHLGINGFFWEMHPDGLNYGGFALHITPRDLAKIGLLIIQEGIWKSSEIVPAVWIGESTTLKTGGEGEEFPAYGYFWHIDPGRSGFYAKGRGGQFLYILPEHNLAVVHTANPYSSNNAGVSFEEFELLLDMIIDSIE